MDAILVALKKEWSIRDQQLNTSVTDARVYRRLVQEMELIDNAIDAIKSI